MAERAEPPIEADENKPSIAPLLSSGSASSAAEEKTVFPAQFRKALRKKQMHIGRNSLHEKAMSAQITEFENPRAIIQNLALGENLIMPRNITQTRDPIVFMDSNIPYCSSEKPFSAVKGSISE